MGGIISRLRQSNDSDYEKILSDLDSNIRKAEMRLSAINVRERRLLGYWLVYSVLAWLGYAAVFVMYLHQQYLEDPQLWALTLAPIILGLPIIYVGRSLITVWYKRAKNNEESQLYLLKADQRLKVEELKKKTAYYSTKTLLERYDPSSQRSGGSRPTGPDGRPAPTQQNGQPKPQQPNMMDPGMRQRQGLGVTNAQGIPVGQGRPAGFSSGIQQQQHQQQQLHNGHGPQSVPRGPQGSQGPQQFNYDPSQPRPSDGRPSPYGSPNTERHWYDKIVDVIVGDEGPDTKFALICGQCFAHNGLALPQEIDDIQYVCPKCNFFNPSRRRTRLGAELLSPSTPELTLLRAQGKPLPASRDTSPSPSAQRAPLSGDRHHQEGHLNRYNQRHDGPSDLAEDSSPEAVSDLPILQDHVDHSETDDIEFVNNWNDSDAEGVNHDEDDVEENDEEAVDSDEVPGYVVDPEEAPKLMKASKKKAGPKTKAGTATGAAAAAAGTRKSTRV